MGKESRKAILIAGGNARARLQTVDHDERANVRVAGDAIKRISSHNGPLRVLVADSNRDATDSLSILVRKWGHTVHRTYDGTTAFKMAPIYQPDVLLLDVGLPGMDGYCLVQLLRRQVAFQDTLMIAIAGWADAAHRLLGEKAGFDVCLVKPVDPVTIETLLLLERERLALSSVDAGRTVTKDRSAQLDTVHRV